MIGASTPLPNIAGTSAGDSPEWMLLRLADIADVEYGRSKPKESGTVPVIGSGGIYAHTNAPLINFATVVIGRKGSAGEVWFVDAPSWPSDTTFYLRWKRQVDVYFVSNYLRLNRISGQHAKTTVPSLQKTDLEQLIIRLPPLAEQQRIAQVLSTIQRAIEAQEKLIMAVRELKRSLMRHLFTYGTVPVREAANVQLKETEIGLIPQSWKLVSLGSLATTMTDYVANGSFAALRKNVQYREHEGYALLLRLADHSADFQSDFVYVDERAYQFLAKTKLRPGDIILSNVGARLGTVFRAPDLGKPMTLGPNAILLRTNNWDDYLFYWLQSEIGANTVRSLATKTAQPKFNKTDLKKAVIPLPVGGEEVQITSMLSAVDSKITIETKRARALALLFESLLLHLMTGKIRVPETLEL